jgi:hypothetical protein
MQKALLGVGGRQTYLGRNPSRRTDTKRSFDHNLHSTHQCQFPLQRMQSGLAGSQDMGEDHSLQIDRLQCGCIPHHLSCVPTLGSLRTLRHNCTGMAGHQCQSDSILFPVFDSSPPSLPQIRVDLRYDEMARSCVDCAPH